MLRTVRAALELLSPSEHGGMVCSECGQHLGAETGVSNAATLDHALHCDGDPDRTVLRAIDGGKV